MQGGGHLRLEAEVAADLVEHRATLRHERGKVHLTRREVRKRHRKHPEGKEISPPACPYIPYQKVWAGLVSGLGGKKGKGKGY